MGAQAIPGRKGEIHMIIRAAKPGQAPVVLDSAPLAERLLWWARAEGYDRIWIMDNEGVIDPLPEPCCYGSAGE